MNITVITYRVSDGLIVATASGDSEAIGNQTPDEGLACAELMAQCGMYYDAATGVVSDTAPVVASPVIPGS